MSRFTGEIRLVVLAWVVAVLALGFSSAGQASILEEMEGEVRLVELSTCGQPFLELAPTPSGDFHVYPGMGGGGGGPGSISLSVGPDSLTASGVRSNEVRRVDPTSGRPIEGGASPEAGCPTGLEPECWREEDPTVINTNAFDAVCATTRGLTSLDPEACGQDVYNSQLIADPTAPASPTLAQSLALLMSGQDPNAESLIAGGGLFLALAEPVAGWNDSTTAAMQAMTDGNPWLGGYQTPLVPLVVNPHDGPAPSPSMHPEPFQAIFTQFGLSRHLTDQQEALFACGPFYGNNCDIHGPSFLTGRGLMRTEASSLFQSFPRLGGACGSSGWDTSDPALPQPGTVGFAGEPVCARYDEGTTSLLPGCRGPADADYDPTEDGGTTGAGFFEGATSDDGTRVHPFTGQEWASEMAVFSWNHLVSLVALSFAADLDDIQITEFDPDDPFRLDGCSFANPLACSNVAGTLSITTLAPEVDPSQPPLRRWLWETGAEYLVAEASGDLEDFLGWKLFAFGPEQSRASGAEIGFVFLLSPPDPLPPIPDSPLIVRWTGNGNENFAGVAYGLVATAECDDGIDNDGDGHVDWNGGPQAEPADPGCADASDLSERDPTLVCDNGADDDTDGAADYPADIGCRNPSWMTENPECDDGVDNADNDDPALADWDGAGLGGPDPQCMAAWDRSESPGSSTQCGSSAGMVLLALPMIWLQRTRRCSAIGGRSRELMRNAG